MRKKYKTHMAFLDMKLVTRWPEQRNNMARERVPRKTRETQERHRKSTEERKEHETRET